MTRLDVARPAEMPALPAEHASTDADPQLLRIRRIGKRMFDVSDCVITLGPLPDCADLPAIGRRFAGEGAPALQFYVSHPVYHPDRSQAGCLCLFDYAPKPFFGNEERRMLADLAALVERELELRSLNASQFALQKKNKNLRRKSLIDPLLGTWNRGAIMRILSIETIRCDKAGLPLSLIVADLDYFKKINDTHGHPAGDAMLVKVASRLRSCIRPQGTLGGSGS